MSDDRRPRLSAAARRQLLVRGVEEFQQGLFFAAHESWETVWRSTTPEPRDLLQGLIQIAAGLYAHRELGRVEGARRTLARGLERLARHPGEALGIDLSTLAAGTRRWLDWLAAGAEGEAPSLPALRLLDDGALQ